MLVRNIGLGSLLLLLCSWQLAAAQEVRVNAGDPLAGQRFYGGLDYLHWWVKGAPLAVPLVSTGPNANSQGFLINSDSTILYGAPQSPAVGGKNVQDFGGFAGGRLTLGYVIDPSQGLAVEASGFGLESRSAGYQTGGTGGTPLVGNGIRVPLYNAVPYFIGVPRDAVAAENGLPVFIPGILGGQVSATNRLNFWGLDAVGVYELYRAQNWSISALAGIRYLDLTEDFDFSDYFYGTGGAFLGQSGVASDHFGTRNQFVGPTIGVRGQAGWGPFSLTAMGRLAIGDVVQELNVAGSFNAVGYTPTSGAQGIFAQPNNSGRRSSNAFAVAPEFQVKLGYDVTPQIRLTVGYDFLYLSDVVRPGDQLDRNLPKGQIFAQGGSAISATYPARLFRDHGFLRAGADRRNFVPVLAELGQFAHHRRGVPQGERVMPLAGHDVHPGAGDLGVGGEQFPRDQRVLGAHPDRCGDLDVGRVEAPGTGVDFGVGDRA